MQDILQSESAAALPIGREKGKERDEMTFKSVAMNNEAKSLTVHSTHGILYVKGRTDVRFYEVQNHDETGRERQEYTGERR